MSYSFRRSPLYGIKSIHVLARILRCPVNFLRLEQEDYEKMYKKGIVTKNRKTRETETPIDRLRSVHDRILNILNRIERPDFLHSGTKERSNLTNALSHQGGVQFYSVDLCDFYQSTTSEYVFKYFVDIMNCQRDLARCLTKLCTFENHIPTGSPISVILSYFVHSKLFGELDSLAKSKDIKMTLYVDDLQFSGDKIDIDFRKSIKVKIKMSGLKIKRKKEKYVHGGKLPNITGVIISKNRASAPWRRHLSLYESLAKLKDNQVAKAEKATVLRSVQGKMADIERTEGRKISYKKNIVRKVKQEIVE